MSTSEANQILTAAAETLSLALAEERLDRISPDVLGRLMALAVRGFAAKGGASGRSEIFAGDVGVTATDVAVTATAMLQAVNMAVFELGMWEVIMRARAPSTQQEGNGQ